MDEGNENDGANCAEVHGPNQKANARAIAALPDLIEALKRIEEFETNNYEIEPPGDIARAALKKAGIK